MKGQEIDGEIKKGAPVFIILTDGEARDKDKRREEVIQKYRSMSRMQIAVGVGSNFNRDELERISNRSSLYFRINFLVEEIFSRDNKKVTWRVFSLDGRKSKEFMPLFYIDNANFNLLN